jgi:hypothetical protein
MDDVRRGRSCDRGLAVLSDTKAMLLYWTSEALTRVMIDPSTGTVLSENLQFLISLPPAEQGLVDYWLGTSVAADMAAGLYFTACAFFIQLGDFEYQSFLRLSVRNATGADQALTEFDIGPLGSFSDQSSGVPSVTMLTNGIALVAWQVYSNPTSETDILFQMFDSAGNPFFAPRFAHTDLSGGLGNDTLQGSIGVGSPPILWGLGRRIYAAILSFCAAGR